MEIRLARVEDAPALLAIYANYIETTITFECTLPTQQEFAARIASVLSAGYPYLVCAEQGRILGYAYAHRLKEREAYQWNAELSVYLDPAATAKGLGRRLYAVLIELLRLQGVRTVYGVVTSPNERSERLHLGMGFRAAANFRSTGYKCGAWRDVNWFEKQIAPYDAVPAPLRPFASVPSAQVREILDRA